MQRGTVETEKQIAWLKKNNAELKKEEELRLKNEKLAELEIPEGTLRERS